MALIVLKFGGSSLAGAHLFAAAEKIAAARLAGDDVIAVCKPTPDGPVLLRRFPCGGCWPRDFAVCGERLIVANERSDSVCVLGFDGEKRSETVIPVPLCVML